MKENTMTDLSNLDVTAKAADGATYTVLHPADDTELMGGDNKPMTIHLLGADSPAFKKAVQQIINATGTRKKLSADEQERNAVNALVKATVGWSDNWVWDGKPFLYSVENCRKLYTQRAWIRSQVDEFIAERSNFFTEA